MCAIVLFLAQPAVAFQATPDSAAASGTSSATQLPATTPASAAAKGDKLPDTVFLRLDKNHDKTIADLELSAKEAVPYAAQLKKADVDGNNRVTWEEFSRLGELPLYRDIRTVAAILLVLGFGAFCLFLDGLFDPEHRDYFWLSLVGTIACVALGFLAGRSWFLQGVPYLAFVAGASLVVIVVAALFGAMREREEPEAAPTGPVVYQVGKPTGTKPGGTKPGAPAAPRKPAPPVRTPRPAPMPRPPVPERRPSAKPEATPRPAPPRPPSSRPPPPGGPKPPPTKS
jgi:hypothetical protein